jgi:hypothetical protein
MEHLQVARLKLDKQYNVINYNVYFGKLFDCTDYTGNLSEHSSKPEYSLEKELNKSDTLTTSNHRHICKIINSPEIDIINLLNKLRDGQSTSNLIFKNTKINDRTQQGLLVIYLNVRKVANEYYFEMVNWITWLHYIHQSLDGGYSCINKFHDSGQINHFKEISDIYCLKALHPLLLHIPNQHFEFINGHSLYNVMRNFIKSHKNKKTKDYSRNAYSRINTSIKEEFGIIHYHHSLGLFLNKPIVDCIRNGEMCIPNTSLHNELLIPINRDYLLEHLIKNTPDDSLELK